MYIYIYIYIYIFIHLRGARLLPARLRQRRHGGPQRAAAGGRAGQGRQRRHRRAALQQRLECHGAAVALGAQPRRPPPQDLGGVVDVEGPRRRVAERRRLCGEVAGQVAALEAIHASVRRGDDPQRGDASQHRRLRLAPGLHEPVFISVFVGCFC